MYLTGFITFIGFFGYLIRFQKDNCIFCSKRYCSDENSINITTLIDDFPDFNLTLNPDRTENHINQSEKVCSADDNSTEYKILDPSLRCKDDFILTQKDDGKIYLTMTYWSKVGTELNSSNFCLKAYNEDQKIAEYCAPLSKPDDKYK